MKYELRVPRAVRNLMVFALAASAIACSTREKDQPDTPITESEPGEREWRDSVLSFSRSLPLNSGNTSSAFLTPGLESGPDALLTPVAAGAANTLGDGEIVARIDSDIAYARLGFAPGENYLWSDTSGTEKRAILIPADTAYRIMWLASLAPETSSVFRPRIHQQMGILTVCRKCSVTTNCPVKDSSRVFVYETDADTLR